MFCVLAVKMTGVPGQTLFADALMLIEGGWADEILIEIPKDAAVVGTAHRNVGSAVTAQLTTSPLFNVDVSNTLLLVPVLMLLIFHL